MPNLRDILSLKPVPTTVAGFDVVISRPTICDLVEAIEINEKRPSDARPWMLHRHLLDASGTPLFASVEDARLCPAHVGAEAIRKIELLYNEGRD